MSSITFVSSFIDIGRGDWSNGYSRTNEIYINNFMKFYSKIELDLILFCENETKIEIEKRIDDNFKTKIRFVNIEKNDINYFKELERVKFVQNSITFKQKTQRDNSNPPEYSNAEYVLMMYAKTEFLKRVKSENLANSQVLCWIDFGIGHGHTSYIDSIEGKKLREMTIEKCMFFSRQNISPVEDPHFYFELSDNVIICGGIFLIPTQLVDYFSDEFKKIVENLIEHNLIDDDQTILSIFASKNPGLSVLIDSSKYRGNPHGGDWFPIFELIE